MGGPKGPLLVEARMLQEHLSFWVTVTEDVKAGLSKLRNTSLIPLRFVLLFVRVVSCFF